MIKVLNTVPTFAFVFILLLISFKSNAQFYTGPIAMAMGGAGRAGVEGSQSVFLNPASLRMSPPVDFSLLYQDGAHSTTEHQTFQGVSLVDNTPSAAFAGSAQYIKRRLFYVGAEPVDGEFVQLSLADWLYRELAVGVSLSRLKQSQGDQSYEEINGTLGFLNPVHKNVNLALVFENIAQENEDVPSALRLHRQLAFGFLYSWQDQFKIAADLGYRLENNPQAKVNVFLGLESLFFEYLYFRVGHQSDNLSNINYLTTGLGFNGPRLKVDYVFQNNNLGPSDAMHGVDFRFVF